MTPEHTKQDNTALRDAANHTMEVCKEVQQTRIKALAKQAGAGIVEHDTEGDTSYVFGATSMPEFVRLVREVPQANQVLDAGHFYNLVMHALMDVGAPHGGCKYRLQDIAKQLEELMLEAAKGDAE